MNNTIMIENIPHKVFTMIIVDTEFDDWTSKITPEQYKGAKVNFNHYPDTEIGMIVDVKIDKKQSNIVYGDIAIRAPIYDKYIDKFTSCSVEIWRNSEGDVYIPTRVSLLTHEVEPAISDTKKIKLLTSNYSSDINSMKPINTYCYIIHKGDTMENESTVLDSIKRLLQSDNTSNNELKEMSDKLSAKEVELKEMSDKLSAKEVELKEMSDKLSAKEVELKEMSYKLSAKEVELKEMSDKLSDKEVELKEMSDKLSAKEVELKEMSDKLSAKEVELKEIKSKYGLEAGEIEDDNTYIKLIDIL